MEFSNLRKFDGPVDKFLLVEIRSQVWIIEWGASYYYLSRPLQHPAAEERESTGLPFGNCLVGAVGCGKSQCLYKGTGKGVNGE